MDAPVSGKHHRGQHGAQFAKEANAGHVRNHDHDPVVPKQRPDLHGNHGTDHKDHQHDDSHTVPANPCRCSTVLAKLLLPFGWCQEPRDKRKLLPPSLRRHQLRQAKRRDLKAHPPPHPPLPSTAPRRRWPRRFLRATAKRRSPRRHHRSNHQVWMTQTATGIKGSQSFQQTLLDHRLIVIGQRLCKGKAAIRSCSVWQLSPNSPSNHPPSHVSTRVHPQQRVCRTSGLASQTTPAGLPKSSRTPSTWSR